MPRTGDSKAPDSTVLITDFGGLIDNLDPRDPPPGAAQDQVNACCVKQGELVIRHGFKVVQFET